MKNTWLLQHFGRYNDANPVVNSAVYPPYGMVMPNRHGNAHYRYGFQGQERDDEISDSGNSIDFGNRMYNPHVGRFLSLDAFASKYPNISPYAFVANNPISNIEMGGDSVLFYSTSGQYLGYSHDNLRYKDKNLLVIIDDKNVDNFVREYNRKRSEEYTKDLTPKQIEAHVAGLEAMGTTYDITSISNFIKKYQELVGPDKDHTSPAPNTYEGQQEWGAFLMYQDNPYYDKTNWITLDENTAVTDEQNRYVGIPIYPDGAAGWTHTHTNTSSKTSFSDNDNHTMRTKPYSGTMKEWHFAVGSSLNGTTTITIQKMNATNAESPGQTKTEYTIQINNNSYKNASKPKFQ